MILVGMNATLGLEHDGRRTQAERTALSDARMLDAAVALVCERGAASTTLKDVGERAGYSRGLASYRFGNKSGLFAFIIRTIGASWLRDMRRAVKDAVGMQAIAQATDAHWRLLSEGRTHIRAFYMLWFDSIGPDRELKSVVAKVHARRRRDVAHWIERGIASGGIAPDADASATSEQFCAAIIGIVYQWLATPDDHDHIRYLHESLKHQTALALQPAPHKERP